MQLNLTPPARMQYCIWCSLFSIGCMSREPYLSQTEQWWHRSGFSSWQRSQKRIAKGRTHPVQSHSSRHRQPPLTPDPRANRVDGGEVPVVLQQQQQQQLVCRAILYLQSWCGCRWADPWRSSSGSPAGTLPDLRAPAAPCQSRTGGTVWCRAERERQTTPVHRGWLYPVYSLF